MENLAPSSRDSTRNIKRNWVLVGTVKNPKEIAFKVSSIRQQQDWNTTEKFEVILRCRDAPPFSIGSPIENGAKSKSHFDLALRDNSKEGIVPL